MRPLRPPRSEKRPIVLDLSAVILAVTADEPRVLTVRHRAPAALAHAGNASEAAGWSLPSGPFDADSDRTLELALRRWIREQSGIEVGYVEQLYTFADRGRQPEELDGGSRLVSIAYLALVREQPVAAGIDALWQDVYDFLPWEDRREYRKENRSKDRREDRRNGSAPAPADPVHAALTSWSAAAPSADRRSRDERLALRFGLTPAGWDGYQALERYELLYEAGAVEEARRQVVPTVTGNPPRSAGRSMLLDHRRILATALARVRGKLKYRPLVFELLPPAFTLLQLQRLVEALAGIRLHKQNFRRLVENARLVEGTGSFQSGSSGRPAELFHFRRDVLRERQGSGMRLTEAAPRQGRR